MLQKWNLFSKYFYIRGEADENRDGIMNVFLLEKLWFFTIQ